MIRKAAGVVREARRMGLIWSCFINAWNGVLTVTVKKKKIFDPEELIVMLKNNIDAKNLGKVASIAQKYEVF